MTADATSEQFSEQVRALLGLGPDADPAAMLTALDRALEERAEDPPAAPGVSITDAVRWAIDTGRIAPVRAQFWQEQAAEEERRTGSAAQTVGTLQALSAVYDPPEVHASTSSPWVRDPESGHLVLASAARPGAGDLTETPLLDDLDRQVFGLSADERYRAEDLAAEAELAAAAEREREEAAGSLTKAEERAIFGDEPSTDG